MIAPNGFQSTLPMRGATCARRRTAGCPAFQSTLPMRGATIRLKWHWDFIYISIHTPHAGSDHLSGGTKAPSKKFQSTLPMRGATAVRGQIGAGFAHFNPHSPCGERRDLQALVVADSWISIHTPHAGSDSSAGRVWSFYPLFQSTLPMRGATYIRPV